MEYIGEKPVLNYEECIKYIMGSTALIRRQQKKVTGAETEYMTKVSIVHINEEK